VKQALAKVMVGRGWGTILLINCFQDKRLIKKIQEIICQLCPPDSENSTNFVLNFYLL